MTVTPEIISAAGERADAAKAQMLGAVGIARQRFAPASLRKEATDKAMDKALSAIDNGKQYARTHPAHVVGIVALIIAWFARRPLMALLLRLSVRLKQRVTGASSTEPPQDPENG